VVVLQIVKADFSRGKWRFKDGMVTFWAAVEDEGFNERLDGGLRVGVQDNLRCRLRDTQYEDSEGALHREIVVREVLEVLEVLEPPTQQSFLTGG